MGDRLTSSTGRPLCDVCSDVIEAHEHRVQVGGRLLHDDCAAHDRRRLRLVAS